MSNNQTITKDCMTYSTNVKFKLFFSSGDMITVLSRQEAIKEIEVRINELQDCVMQVIEYTGSETIVYKPVYSAVLNWTEYTNEGGTYSL